MLGTLVNQIESRGTIFPSGRWTFDTEAAIFRLWQHDSTFVDRSFLARLHCFSPSSFLVNPKLRLSRHNHYRLRHLRRQSSHQWFLRHQQRRRLHKLKNLRLHPLRNCWQIRLPCGSLRPARVRNCPQGRSMCRLREIPQPSSSMFSII